MMKRDDKTLDMFGEGGAERPTAQVVPFPLNRRRRKILQVARTLADRKTPEGKKAYWRRTISALARELGQRGVGRLEIERQLMMFRSAVDIEMRAETRQA